MVEENNILVKLKRLKIEEETITKSILQHPDGDADDDHDLTEYLTKCKKSLEDINGLLDDIRFRITSEDIEDLDIDDVKRDIINLETKIKALKSSYKTELSELKQEENSFCENNEKPLTKSAKPATSVHIEEKASMKDIVTSPVRLMIDSPFKCPEVQQMLEFMKNSKNKYGGWSPYYHNIFAAVWEKHFDSEKNPESCYIVEDELIQSSAFKDFKYDLLRKIPDLTVEEITSHSLWYWNYVNLKIRQQHALNLWKKNKSLIKMARNDNSKLQEKSADAEAVTLQSAKSKSFKAKVEQKSGYTKPTMQWNSKCNSVDVDSIHEYTSQYLHLDQFKKLGVPLWRKSL